MPSYTSCRRRSKDGQWSSPPPSNASRHKVATNQSQRYECTCSDTCSCALWPPPTPPTPPAQGIDAAAVVIAPAEHAHDPTKHRLLILLDVQGFGDRETDDATQTALSAAVYALSDAVLHLQTDPSEHHMTLAAQSRLALLERVAALLPAARTAQEARASMETVFQCRQAGMLVQLIRGVSEVEDITVAGTAVRDEDGAPTGAAETASGAQGPTSAADTQASELRSIISFVQDNGQLNETNWGHCNAMQGAEVMRVTPDMTPRSVTTRYVLKQTSTPFAVANLPYAGGLKQLGSPEKNRGRISASAAARCEPYCQPGRQHVADIGCPAGALHCRGCHAEHTSQRAGYLP